MQIMGGITSCSLSIYKSFANKWDIYPKSLEDVVDIMRQVPPKKAKPKVQNSNAPDKKPELATSLAQQDKTKSSGDEGRCFYCENPTCRLWRCDKKDTVPPKDWLDPLYEKGTNKDKGGEKKA